MKTQEINYTGRKAKTGRICFDEKGKMHVFVTYCDCCNGKLLMTIDEARTFSREYAAKKRKVVDRLLLRLVDQRKI